VPCDTKLKTGQTITQRKEEITRVVARLTAGLINGSIKVKLSPQGAIAFDGLTDQNRDGVTDACAYRRLMATGSPLAKAKIAAAEALLGRQVNRQTVASGLHSHDGGKTWGTHDNKHHH
jgi:hypothetical protein